MNLNILNSILKIIVIYGIGIKLEKQRHEGLNGNYLIFKYKCPKHFLDNNKDYYLEHARFDDSNFKSTDLYLHFNPKIKTLFIYQDKHNNNKTKEAENNKRTSFDW